MFGQTDVDSGLLALGFASDDPSGDAGEEHILDVAYAESIASQKFTVVHCRHQCLDLFRLCLATYTERFQTPEKTALTQSE